MATERREPNTIRVSERPIAVMESNRETSVIRRDREVMSGTPVFAGPRVPVRNLIDYLKAGDDLDRFLDDFPSVSRAKAIAALEEIATATIGPLHADEPKTQLGASAVRLGE